MTNSILAKKKELEARGYKGFTLMEMLIVVAIIAILVAIAIPVFTSQLNRAKVEADVANIRFLTDKKWALTVFRILSGGAFVFLGAVASFEFVWSLGDLFMALVTLCNLIALAFLSKYAFKLLLSSKVQIYKIFRKNT